MDFSNKKIIGNSNEKEETEERGFFSALMQSIKKSGSELTESINNKFTESFENLSTASNDIKDKSIDKYMVTKIDVTNAILDKYYGFTDKTEDLFADISFRSIFYNLLDDHVVLELTHYFGREYKCSSFKERCVKELLLYFLNIFISHKNRVIKELEFEKNEKKNKRAYNRLERMKMINDQTRFELEKLRTNQYYRDLPYFLEETLPQSPQKKALKTLITYFRI